MQNTTDSQSNDGGGTPSPKAVLHKGGLGCTHAALEHGAIDPQPAKDLVSPCAGAYQVNTAAAAAPVPMRVVLREAIKPGLAILRMRLGLLHLQAQISVLALQRTDALSQKGQVLAQHRSTAALVNQRLHFVEQRLKHFLSSSLFVAKKHTANGKGAA